MVWLVLVGLVVAWSVFLYYFQPGSSGRSSLGAPQLSPPQGVNAIDYQWALMGLDGKQVDFARFRGKTLFLNVWATWCGPCVAEMPSIANLVTNSKLSDVEFLCVSVDEDPATVERFLKREKLDVPVAVAVSEPPPGLQTEGIPATFLIGPDGTILAQEIGSARWDTPEVVKRLQALA
ncbi:MAG TPA: TlpA disulfide reductase family protein, partial [Isosphaeraceae bacterium]|nr:TlpA disulfide reductase family protein [Isosphaeraceae bacterium]